MKQLLVRCGAIGGGFSVEALGERIEDSESRVLITADGGYLRGKIVPLKEIANEKTNTIVFPIDLVEKMGAAAKALSKDRAAG